MGEGLPRPAEEIRPFRCFHNDETGQLLLPAWANLHVDIFATASSREFKVSANAGAPQIAYRETVPQLSPKAKANSSANPAAAAIRAMPASPRAPTNAARVVVAIVSKIVGGAILPRNISRPVLMASKRPSRAAFSLATLVVDVKVAITDGTFHEVDLQRTRLQMAGIFAVKDAAQKGECHPPGHRSCKSKSPTPDGISWRFDRGLNSSRGKILQIEAKEGFGPFLNAEVPLAEMFSATHRNSLALHRPRAYSMEPFSFRTGAASIVALSWTPQRHSRGPGRNRPLMK